MADQDSRQVPISEAMRLAIDHHQAGRLAEAEVIYQAVLDAEPAHAGAKYNLALIELQSGRPRQALPVFRDAMQREPDNGAHWLNYAVALAGNGEPQSAREILLLARERGLGGQALAGLLAQVERMTGAPRPAVIETVGDKGPAQARAPNLDALESLLQSGQYAQAEAQARELWMQFPESAPIVRVLGSALLAQDRCAQARDVLADASERLAGDARLQHLLGLALRRLRRNEDARAAFERSLALDPDRFDTLLNASANAVSLADAAEALRYAERALAQRPDSVDALRVFADAAAAGGRHEVAVEHYRRGLELDPDAADLYVNLGDSLTSLRRPDESTTVVAKALALRPGDIHAHLALGRALFALGETTAARGQYRTASDLAPENSDAHTAYLFSLLHDASVTPEQSFAEHLRIGELIEAPHRHPVRPHENDRDPERGLRLGFVSGDLRDHAVAYLIEPIWRAMHGGRHQVFAYANNPFEDAVSERLRTLTDSWVRVGRLDDEALAELIRRDRIDILFDLSGYTTYNRLPVFATKPAPIQVSWLGYPATTGMAAIDYRFMRGLPENGDPIERQFREQVVRLRQRRFEPEPGAPAVQPAPALVCGHLCFGNFNRPSKISESTVDLWSRVLNAIPDSTLLIAPAGEARTQDRLRSLFAVRGISAERLRFRGWMPMPEYLAMYNEVDIVLDTFPFTGGTTTNHALWMGVPVLTLDGESPQQRLAAGIVGALGLPDWVVHSTEAFVERAKVAAADVEGLNRLRLGLRAKAAAHLQGSPQDVAREMDAALRTIWRRWCAGLEPQSFTVSA